MASARMAFAMSLCATAFASVIVSRASVIDPSLLGPAWPDRTPCRACRPAPPLRQARLTRLSPPVHALGCVAVADFASIHTRGEEFVSLGACRQAPAGAQPA